MTARAIINSSAAKPNPMTGDISSDSPTSRA